MKKTLGLLLALFPILIYAQGSYTIDGHLGGLSEGKITLHRYTLETGAHVDTATITNGQFKFKGKTPDNILPGQLIFYIGQNSNSVVFYLEAGHISIDYPAGAEYAHLAGTPLNDQLQQYDQLLFAFLDSVNATRPGKEPYKWWSKEIMDGKIKIIKKFVEKHPASYVGLEQLINYAIGNKAPDVLDSTYRLLASSLQKSPKGVELANRIKGMRSTEVGDIAQMFTLPDTAGNNVSLTDYKGKYVLVDFWATWCIPCMEEMPNIIKAYQQYKGKGLEIIGVSLDRPDTKELWKKTIRLQHMDWIQVSDLKWWNSKAALLYNVNSAPSNFLIDPKGIIIAKNLRGPALQQKLDSVFSAGSGARAGGQTFELDGKVNAAQPLTGKIYLQYEDDNGAGRDSCTLTDNSYHFSGVMKDGALKVSLFWKHPTDSNNFSGFAQFFIVPGKTQVEHAARFNTFEIPGSVIEQQHHTMDNLYTLHTAHYSDSMKAFIRQYPDSWLAYVGLDNMTRRDMIGQDTAAALYEILSPRLRSFDMPRELYARIKGMQNNSVGNMAAEITENDMNGHPVSLSSFRGKYVLVKFWASWCHPCRTENKVLGPIYHKYKDKGFEVLGVSIDNAVGRNAWLKAVSEDAADWTQIADLRGSTSPIPIQYGVVAVPTNFLIDPKGKIIAKNLMGEPLDKKLQELLN